ncbi:MAG: thermopsin family protease, partial [Thermoplasmata archaeon]
MSYNLRLVFVLAVAVAALMVVPVASVAAPTSSLYGGPTTAAGATHSAVPAIAAASSARASTGTLATENRILSALKSDHVPMSHVFLPNFNSQVSVKNNVISPLYTESPAPMGLGDFGVQDVGGANVGTITYTSSIEGAATLNAVDPLYVTSSAPDEFTIQLNTVLNHVDILNNTNYDFWIQNVPVYAAGSHTLSFENNIWNFSSPATFMGYNAIYSGRGSIVGGGEVYITEGPTYFNIPTPFTVSVYNNASVVNDRPTVFFNYSVTDALGSFSGSYDQVEFNSSATPPTTAAPMPTFQIDGQSANPTNFLLNDAEIMLGGPGGGSTTTLFNIAGSMGLWLLPNGTATMQTVPAAYDFGTDTGETSEGIAEASTTGPNSVATLSSGPSLLYPLWGILGAHPGAESITLHLTPSNAFVFANPGNFINDSVAAWAPTPVSGPAVYVLSPQQYTFEFLLADHAPVTMVVGSASSVHLSVSLAMDTSLGVYTPLWAMANSQLKAISMTGTGSTSNPYVLDNQPGVINPLFGELNDYAFQVFPGINLIDTT